MLTSETIEYEGWAASLTLDSVRRRLRGLGCDLAVVKVLVANNNSKQQIWLAKHLNDLAFIPFGSPRPHRSKSKKREEPLAIFHSHVHFAWLGPSGRTIAPHAKLIYYPQYPEVRLSGFLRDCRNAPSHLLRIEERGQEEGRLLVLGIDSKSGSTFGLVVGVDCPLAEELRQAPLEQRGVLSIWRLAGRTGQDPRVALLKELGEISAQGWVPGQRLTRAGPIAYGAENGGGYTLEALLGIMPNANSAPDLHGYEVKQVGVRNLNRPQRKDVTLFDTVPDGGEFRRLGASDFVRIHGHFNQQKDRFDFAGRHRAGSPPPRTGASLRVSGYEAGRIQADGAVELVGKDGEMLMEWSFAKLMDHWSRKHARAAYVPSESRRIQTADGLVRQYRYSQIVWMGEGTDFAKFLDAVVDGVIRYDPGMHAPGATRAGSSKVRSLFRISSQDLNVLYADYNSIDTRDSQ